MTDPPTPRHSSLRHLLRAAWKQRTRNIGSNIVFQTSTMSALLAGVYDGDVTIAELLTHGDLGVGTFNHLDGEMIVLDGTCHRLRADGTATPAAGTDLTPFAVVTWFVPDTVIDIDTPSDLDAIDAHIRAHTHGRNVIQALKVSGHFDVVRTRTVAAQHRPYPPLTDVTREQSETTMVDLEGTLVGFLSPDFEQGLTVAGFHWHFLSADHRRGGHVLDVTLAAGTVSIAASHDLHLSLPTTQAFQTAALTGDDLDAQIRRAEDG